MFRLLRRSLPCGRHYLHLSGSSNNNNNNTNNGAESYACLYAYIIMYPVSCSVSFGDDCVS